MRKRFWSGFIINNIQIKGKWQQYPVMELRQYAKLIYSKKPSLISIEMTGFKWNHKVVINANEEAYCKAAIIYRLSEGFITSGDALWMACYILKHHQEVSKALVARFPYIIVDEAQDNSELSFEFLELLKFSRFAKLRVYRRYLPINIRIQ